MGDESEINLPLLQQAVDRLWQLEGAPALPTMNLQGEVWVLVPRGEASALSLAASAFLTLATLLPKTVKVSE